MTREKAVAVTRALNDVEDFEMFMEQIDQVFLHCEGDLDNFYHTQLLPLLTTECNRRKQILEEM